MCFARKNSIYMRFERLGKRKCGISRKSTAVIHGTNNLVFIIIFNNGYRKKSVHWRIKFEGIMWKINLRKLFIHFLLNLFTWTSCKPKEQCFLHLSYITTFYTVCLFFENKIISPHLWNWDIYLRIKAYFQR